MSDETEYAEMKAQVDAAKDERKAATLSHVGDASRRQFIKDCLAEGIDPARGVSPSLLRLLGWRHQKIDGKITLVSPWNVSQES